MDLSGKLDDIIRIPTVVGATKADANAGFRVEGERLYSFLRGNNI